MKVIGYSDTVSSLLLTVTLFHIPNGVAEKERDCNRPILTEKSLQSGGASGTTPGTHDEARRSARTARRSPGADVSAARGQDARLHQDEHPRRESSPPLRAIAADYVIVTECK